MKNSLVFIHGLESTAQGAKGQYFSQNFPQMIIEDYVGDFTKRMNKLNSLLAGKNDLIIVGSSYGGLMAVQYSMENESRIKKLILLAPALNLPEFKANSYKPLMIPVIIYHGTNDNIVNPKIVKKIALKCFSNLEHHLVEDDHSLHKTFPVLDWEKLLMTG
ncbi:MAG: alpha/beta hydrolase [Deltaproteobacteria bacterium]|nr:alpha/beta hydrolase [Deltaproteobacteria bacterium]